MKSREKCVKLISQGTVIALIGSLLIGSQRSEGQVPENAFVVYSYQGKTRCLDYTPKEVGSPIFINSCSLAHPIIVEEISAQHTVRLHAGTNVIGAQVPRIISQNGTAPADTGVQEIPLVLQNPINTVVVGSENQEFALDGDSIIFFPNRDLVAQVQNARGLVGTPVVLGERNLADNEFWDFVATDGSGKDPTSGFVHVTTADNLLSAVGSGGYGTVVKVDASIDLSGKPTMYVNSGVTIRGDRRGTNDGPTLSTTFDGKSGLPDSFDIQGDDVRIAGLMLQGPNISHNTARNQENSTGIMILSLTGANQLFAREFLRTIVDHNDISDFTYAGVRADFDELFTYCEDDPYIGSDPQNRPTNSHVWRNFIHHNMMEELGYGVDNEHGGYQLIAGNTFIDNRHAIAGDGDIKSGYHAWYNLVLSEAPLQHGIFHTHDFDMHGTDTNGGTGYGGVGGDYMDIYQNTFLGSNRPNFTLRGNPCNYAEFHNNISLESPDDAVNWQLCGSINIWLFCPNTGPQPPSQLRVSPQPAQFNHPNPTNSLGVGNFDGDSYDDLFLATGTSWYYSPAGKVEWRFLSPKSETIDQVLLGDFDGDGRTDVVAIRGGQLVVSWGGISDWEVLNPNISGLNAADISNMRVGDFDGDGLADIFFDDGQTWLVSYGVYGGTTPFVTVGSSSYPVKDLRFGDFDGNGTTDVFGVGPRWWMVSYSPKLVRGLFSPWQLLRNRLTNSVNGLVVADFNGDHVADVAANCDHPDCWRISYGGFEDWYEVTQPFGLVGPEFAAVGHFLGGAETDVLSWNALGLCDPHIGQNSEMCISVAAIFPTTRYSTQDMR